MKSYEESLDEAIEEHAHSATEYKANGSKYVYIKAESFKSGSDWCKSFSENQPCLCPACGTEWYLEAPQRAHNQMFKQHEAEIERIKYVFLQSTKKQDEHITQLESDLSECHKTIGLLDKGITEQCRLNGMGAQRELKLQTELNLAQKSEDNLQAIVESQYDDIQTTREDLGFWKKEAMLHSDAREQLKKELLNQEEIIAKMEEALNFYGNWKNWYWEESRVGDDSKLTNIKNDHSVINYLEEDGLEYKNIFGGKLAREVLNVLKEYKDKK